MDLYTALQEIHDKVQDSQSSLQYSQTDRDILMHLVNNQVRMSEAMLILGSLLHAIVEDRVEVEVVPPKGVNKH
jgi:CRISPR/Cas system-associated exonuclease Cas4 (RecB family)